MFRQETPSREGVAVTIALLGGLRHSVYSVRSDDLCSYGGVSVDRALIPKLIMIRADRGRDAELARAQRDQRSAAGHLVSRPRRGAMGRPARMGHVRVTTTGRR